MKLTPLVYYFGIDKDSKKIPNLTEVGGKALSLIKTSKAGFNVPFGIILTQTFFNGWTKDTQNFTEEQKTIIDEGLKKINYNSKDYLSVRSSSPEEDLEGTSFAGMYETSLNIKKRGLQKAIIKSFLSSFDKRVADYKKEHGFSKTQIDNPKIAVIIQLQINSEKAGVGFSINPLNNSYDEAVIDANYGLGENVVSGNKTPDTYVIEKIEKKILEKKLGEKRKKSVLSNDEIIKVTKLISDVEKFYKMPMDIEWAFYNDILYLLQARPITAYFKIPKSLVTEEGADKKSYIDTMIIKQGLVDPMSVLGMEALTLISSLMGASDMMNGNNKDFVVTYGGKMYLNMAAFIKFFGRKKAAGMFALADANTSEFILTLPKEYTKGRLSFKIIKDMMKIMTNVFDFDYIKAWKNPDLYYKKYIQAEKEVQDKLTKLKKGNYSFEYIQKQVVNDLGEYFHLGVMLVVLGEISRYNIKNIFKNEPKKVRDKEYLLEMALPNNITIEMGLWMYKISQNPEFKRVKTYKTFEKKLKEKSFSKDFLDDWNAFIKKHGIRAFKELDIKYPRNYEDIESLWEKIFSMSGNIGENNPLTQFEKTKERREKTFKELYKIAEKKGKGEKFEINYNNLITFSGYRESPKYYLIFVIDIIRQKALKLGLEFKKQKRLDNIDDIFDLNFGQIIRGEKNKKIDLRKIRQKNLQEYKTWEGVKNFPKFFDSRGKIFTTGKKSKDKNIILGTPISPGIVKGKVKILHSADEKPLLPGEILVTRATDPGWTPLFVNASGVLLEVGGILQHGALVAREYGKPCIAGLENIMNILKDGQEVEIDGANGTVKILK